MHHQFATRPAQRRRVTQRTVVSHILLTGVIAFAALATLLLPAPRPAAASHDDQATLMDLFAKVLCGTVQLSALDIAPISRCGFTSGDLHASWMADNADVLGQRQLSQVVMAGAHDALTGLYNGPLDQFQVQTQDLNLWGLLLYGVRQFDMRFCTPPGVDDKYYGCHGGRFDEKVTPASVIATLREFTNHFPREILIIEWEWTPPAGSQALQDSLCSSFFDEFRTIMISRSMATGESTLDEIWALDDSPRIILNTDSCAHYFTNDSEGPADQLLVWPNGTHYYEGKWAESSAGDRDPNVISGDCPGGKCEDVATANTFDLTSILSTTRINNTQLVLTASDFLVVDDGIFGITVDGNRARWPAIRNNLTKLWDLNHLGARGRFNVLLGDFVQHLDLVPYAIKLNAGPRISVEMVHTATGATYTPGEDIWSPGATLRIRCEPFKFDTSVPDFPIKELRLSGSGGNFTSERSDQEIVLNSVIKNGSVTVECSDTGGKHARKTISRINIDPNPPVVTQAILTPAANANGWHSTDVTILWKCSDADSGTTGDVVGRLFGEGMNLSLSAICLDLAGNSSPIHTVSGVNIDRTGPVITLEGRTASNAAGWNNTDVTLTWNCADALSGPASKTITHTRSVEDENQSASLECTDNAGNRSSHTTSDINIDKTSPVISSNATTADGHPYTSGAWTNQDVTVTFDCTDSLSGLGDVSPSVTLANDGADQSVSGICEDVADNQTSATVSDIDIDRTAPAIAYQGRTTPNDGGWNNTDVTITWTCTDALSGILTETITRVLNSEATSQSATAVCEDKASNQTSDTQSDIKIDKTAPVLTASATTADGQPYVPGTWTNQDVMVTFTCVDGLAGVQNVTPAIALDGDGADQSATGTCEDFAGNQSSATVSDIDIDATAPFMVIAISPDPVVLNGNVTASPNAHDLHSGVATQNCDPVDTTSLGNKQLTCTATDVAGNSRTVTFGYTVTYQFSGFTSPISGDTLNVANAGKAIPIKFRLTDANGAPMTDLATATITSVSLDCSSQSGSGEPVEEYAAGDSGLQNLGAGYYQINWKSLKSDANSCRELRLNLGEGSDASPIYHTAAFRFE